MAKKEKPNKGEVKSRDILDKLSKDGHLEGMLGAKIAVIVAPTAEVVEEVINLFKALQAGGDINELASNLSLEAKEFGYAATDIQKQGKYVILTDPAVTAVQSFNPVIPVESKAIH